MVRQVQNFVSFFFQSFTRAVTVKLQFVISDSRKLSEPEIVHPKRLFCVSRPSPMLKRSGRTIWLNRSMPTIMLIFAGLKVSGFARLRDSIIVIALALRCWLGNGFVTSGRTWAKVLSFTPIDTTS